MYHQDNSAHQFQLECDIAEYTRGNLSIQDYDSGFRTLWSEYEGIKYANVSDDVLKVIQDLQASSHQEQFLMKLHPEFETVTSSLMSRKPLPSLDVCLNEILREEQRIQTKAHLVQQKNETLHCCICYPWKCIVFSAFIGQGHEQSPTLLLPKVRTPCHSV